MAIRTTASCQIPCSALPVIELSNQLGAGHVVGLILIHVHVDREDISEHMKDHVYLKCRERYEDIMMIDHCSDIHHLSSCEINAWKKI